MTLQRISAEKPDFKKLEELVIAIRCLLNMPESSEMTLDELLAFQDDDGSFKLFDSYQVPGDARVDFCHTPTYISAAILMRELLSGREGLTGALETALKASMHRELKGYGYDGEDGRVDAMNIFIKGGLRDFLETRREICPEFHLMIHNILHEYSASIITGNTKHGWDTDYRERWQGILDELSISSRIHIAYGSNMDKKQMLSRCPNAVYVGVSYIEDWQLTMPFYANIEPSEKSRTPVLVWEIDAANEVRLDICEGYPTSYKKMDIIVSINGRRMSAMAYVMTEEYKCSGKYPRDGYVEQIKQAYTSAGFTEDDFMPS